MDSNLTYIITHVFLPPKLPQRDDGDASKSAGLIKELLAALKSFENLSEESEKSQWTPIIEMAETMLRVRDHSQELLAEELKTKLENLRDGGVLALEIRGQNAGLILRRLSDQYLFESFEISPTAEAVIGAQGRLRRCFPGPAIAVEEARLKDVTFREALANILVQLDNETPEEAFPITMKASSEVVETRDTINPKFVTEMLTGIFRAVGRPIDVPRVLKCTRDDVLLKNAPKPWRRSPTWLFLRVAMQTSLMRFDLKEKSHLRYKSFMIFFMARILEGALQASLSSGLLFAMVAKISRRAMKLGKLDQSSSIVYTQEVVTTVQQELNRRWNVVIKNPVFLGMRQSWEPSKLSFFLDTRLTLSKLQPYLEKIQSRVAATTNESCFTPECSKRVERSSLILPELDSLRNAKDGNTGLFLMDLELWVQDYLSDWLSANIEYESTSSSLAKFIDIYSSEASSVYVGKPEEISVMILVIMELWVALDKCAVRHFPLLCDYDPQFPPKLFEPILLSKQNQFERLFRIENYLSGRREGAISSAPNILQSHHSSMDFAVRYFDRSSKHKELRLKIEDEARDKRSQKLSELSEKRRQYDSLMQQSCAMSCQFVSQYQNGRQVPIHSDSCEKCNLKTRANQLTIEVFEHPLPCQDLEVKSVIFELAVPSVISNWRDATYSILVDILTAEQDGKRQQNIYILQDYVGLANYYQGKTGRIQLASTTKPFIASHYRDKSVSEAKEDNICVSNGLRYSMYDRKTQRLTGALLGHCDVREKCTLKLPSGPYQRLQYAVANTIHTSNEVIANQIECPETLTMHEYYAFITLRSGHRLQWLNIARELVAHVLNFNREETYTLITQAIWQAGPFDKLYACRESHIDPKEEEFGHSLLSALNDALDSIEGNWQGAVAARAFISLTTRLLSLSQSDTICEGCFQMLRKAQQVTLRWTRQLNKKLQEGQKEEESNVWAVRTLEMALTCHGIYDVDRHHLGRLLSSHDDIAAVTECSIIVHDRCPAVIDGLSSSMKTMLRRHWRLSHLLEPVLRVQIIGLQGGLDRTISRLWAGYKPGMLWNALDMPNERWLVTETSREGGFRSMLVHYNILDGSLLVNGLPLTGLPKSYESHPNYRLLFGEKVLEIAPSTIASMVFETRNTMFGHQVYFRMHESELIIWAKKNNELFELLPMHALEDDFPQSFVQCYAHWLGIDSCCIEWRPLTNVWISSLQNWWMRPTAHDAFGLESKQFRGMMIDTNQSIGTLTGLESKLVLRGYNDSSRSIIIPHGDVNFQRSGHHVHVQINTTSLQHVTYHLYQIDSQLGRLVDDGSFKSKLFKCYLHALTAHCLTDELTGRTGTEEALWELAAASTRSFLRLEQAEVGLLGLIAQLTARRQYYPQHLRMMQEVHWNNLPPLSQHNSFYKLVTSIFKQVEALQVFLDKPIEIPQSSTDENLLKRAAIRDSTYRVHNFGAEDHTTEHDAVYFSRDYIPESSREYQSFHTAKLVDDWSSNLKCCSQLLHEIESWGEPIQFPQAKGTFVLGYDIKWLDKPARFLPSSWCALQHALSRSTAKSDKYNIMFTLSTMAYSRYANQKLIETLLAFATISKLRTIQPPKHELFQLSYGYKLDRKRLVDATESHNLPIHLCPENSLPQLSYETKAAAKRRRVNEYHLAKENRIKKFVDYVIPQWPSTEIRAPKNTDCNTYISMEGAVKGVQKCFEKWAINIEYRDFVTQIQCVLDELAPKEETLQLYSFLQSHDNYFPKQTYIDFKNITEDSAPNVPLASLKNLDSCIIEYSERQSDYRDIKSLLRHLSSKSQGGYEQQYTNDLLKSFDSLHEDKTFKLDGSPTILKQPFEEYLQECKDYVLEIYDTIREHLRAKVSTICQLAHEADLGPRLSPISLLHHLNRGNITALHSGWRHPLVRYGLAITMLQRAERLDACNTNETELLGELRNAGHECWNPMQYPEWLLLEIENNILIRSVQAQIASEMISPSSGTNSIMQLNMGEGKSSLIVPMVAAALADGKNLVRVVVLKQLSTQMFQLLAKKLGGMLDRRIFYMPFSRSLKLEVHQANHIRNMYEECMYTGGILLVQPEHLLSFELMGPERLLSDNPELGGALIRTQKWLDENSRDILDESDEILSVRFELIYTIGTQRATEFSPNRWAIAAHVLGLVGHFAKAVFDQFPDSLTFRYVCPGSFPRIRILDSLAGDKLLQMIAHEVCDAGLPGVPVWKFPQKIRNILYSFLTKDDLDKADTELLQYHAFNIESLSSSLLLLKGMIAGGILTFAFKQRRWRVNYGLDLSRTMLAVPYRAKDNPATRAEFSHPDVTIVLTCLSYYHGGLSNEQLCVSFETLVLWDNAEGEYERWVQCAPELPPAFQQLRGINLNDSTQCTQQVFPFLRLAKSVIDFYLSEIVFPKEMKEFPHKLSASGWDIARKKGNPTTGFSGTNDSRYVLPLTISQCDFPQQLHTNATQLNCLLRPGNSFIKSASGSVGECLGAESLLQLIVKLAPPVRVIIDVGAQVLELQNKEVACTWLSRIPASEAQAAVFFDHSNELTVLSRDGITEPLMISPFAKQLDQCLVYLDEVHTRGTDLKLPTDYRAVVTLGPDLTKDRLVQACMRMRKLGKGQSVVFCGPTEVERNIIECSGKAFGDDIEVEDVLKWSISETHMQTRKCIPLWATQGMRQQRRFTTWSKLENDDPPPIAVKEMLETEAQSLQDRYGFGRKSEDELLLQSMDDITLELRKTEIGAIQAKCQMFELSLFKSAAFQEEQERELSPENERERQIEHPPSLKPRIHSIHKDLNLFIRQGSLNRLSKAFQPAFESLKNTSAFTHFESNAWPHGLLVTSDFAQTVHAENQLLDSFLRPVHWIASNKQAEFIILSPYEANELLPSIRQRKAVTLHIYSPRTNFFTRALDDLSFCAIPAVPQTRPILPNIMQLNLFAGQLYLKNHNEYLQLCRFLGLCFKTLDSDDVSVSYDGFISPADRASFDTTMAAECPFTTSPIEFLRVLMALRRKGQSITFSHLGGILRGALIRKDQF